MLSLKIIKTWWQQGVVVTSKTFFFSTFGVHLDSVPHLPLKIPKEMAFQFTGQERQKLVCASNPSPLTMAVWKGSWLVKSCGPKDLHGELFECLYTKETIKIRNLIYEGVETH